MGRDAIGPKKHCRVEDAFKISNAIVAEALDGLPPVKMHCSVLVEDALKGAIEDYRNKQRSKVGLS